MSHNINGLVYEHSVYNTIKENGNKISVLGEAPSGGFNAHDTDMTLMINNQKIDLEIKANLNAQMGGTSISYQMESKLFESVKPIPERERDLILSEINQYIPSLDNLLEELKKGSPVGLNSPITGFPLSTTKQNWEDIKKRNFLVPLNAKVERNTDFLHDHYSKKGVNYIQIGGAGLFYLKNNPLNLPIPQLNGNMTLEIRPGRSGSKIKEYRGNFYEIVGAGIRVQGRLKFKGKSDFTLDDPNSLKELERLI